LIVQRIKSLKMNKNKKLPLGAILRQFGKLKKNQSVYLNSITNQSVYFE